MKRTINAVVIHCSDSPDKLDIGAAEIRQWHLERGFADIGYHWVVRRSGAIERGRAPERIGAHVSGRNKDTIGICWVGRSKPTDVQLKALAELAAAECQTYGLASSAVRGHRELAPLAGKTCPNLDMDIFRQLVDQLTLPEPARRVR